jgi:hypothetical protein
MLFDAITGINKVMHHDNHPLPAAILKVYHEQEFVQAVCRALDFAPELKHENQFSTEISIHLNRFGVPSEREFRVSGHKTEVLAKGGVRERGRRHDLNVTGSFIEAKYHYEGDLVSIREGLTSAKKDPVSLENQLKPTRQTASSDMVRQAVQNKNQWLLWFVAVRSLEVNIDAGTSKFRCQSYIPKFYLQCGAKNLADAHQDAAKQMDEIVSQEFSFLRGTASESIPLPPIVACRGALVSRLIKLPTRA